jgi:hypothetical protein
MDLGRGRSPGPTDLDSDGHRDPESAREPARGQGPGPDSETVRELSPSCTCSTAPFSNSLSESGPGRTGRPGRAPRQYAMSIVYL